MADQEARFKGSMPREMAKLMPTELTELGKKGVEATLNLQKEMSAAIEQAGKNWTDRLKVESELASEFAAKLTSCKSVPETAQVYQEWLARRMKLVFDDGQQLIADGQKLMNSYTRAVFNGGPGGST